MVHGVLKQTQGIHSKEKEEKKKIKKKRKENQKKNKNNGGISRVIIIELKELLALTTKLLRTSSL